MFTRFLKGDYIIATEMMDNFYHIGQGNWLPRGGVDLEATTSVYNLGSSDNKWDNVYCKSLDFNGTNVKNAICIVTETTITSATTSIEFTNLNSDDGKGFYFFSMDLVHANTATSIYLHLNRDTATNYSYEYVRYQGLTLTMGTGTSDGLVIGEALTGITATSLYSKIDLFLQGRAVASGRGCISHHIKCVDEEYIYGMADYFSHWNDLTTTLTSIILTTDVTGFFLSGTVIKLWRGV